MSLSKSKISNLNLFYITVAKIDFKCAWNCRKAHDDEFETDFFYLRNILMHSQPPLFSAAITWFISLPFTTRYWSLVKDFGSDFGLLLHLLKIDYSRLTDERRIFLGRELKSLLGKRVSSFVSCLRIGFKLSAEGSQLTEDEKSKTGKCNKKISESLQKRKFRHPNRDWDEDKKSTNHLSHFDHDK